MVSYPVQNYKARISTIREFWTKHLWPSTCKAISMLFRNKKYQKRFERTVTTLILVSLFSSMHAPQVQAVGEYGVPEDWPSEWVAPFAEESVSEQGQPPEFPELKDKKPRFIRNVVLSAYSSDVWQNDSTPFLPANGKDYRKVFAEKGAVNCVAYNAVKLGTKIKIPKLYGDTVLEVCDRTHPKHYGVVDVYIAKADKNGSIESREALDMARAAAREIGRQKNVEVWVF